MEWMRVVQDECKRIREVFLHWLHMMISILQISALSICVVLWHKNFKHKCKEDDHFIFESTHKINRVTSFKTNMLGKIKRINIKKIYTFHKDQKWKKKRFKNSCDRLTTQVNRPTHWLSDPERLRNIQQCLRFWRVYQKCRSNRHEFFAPIHFSKWLFLRRFCTFSESFSRVNYHYGAH